VKRNNLLNWLTLVFLVLTSIATAVAAWYTWKQWITADDTEKRQVRAYAFPTPTGIKDFELGKAPIGGIKVGTMGQTPAYKVRGEISVGGLPYPLRDDADLSFQKTGQIQNSAFISPNNAFFISAYAGGILNQTTIDTINDGKKFRLYVWGRIDYEDVFANLHWFTFCYAYDGNSVQGHDVVETCPRHNEDDHH